MRTRSSPSQSEDGNVTVEPATGSKARCDWPPEGVIKHKAEVGDSATFKPVIWNAASQLLEKSHVKDGPKTSKACSEKWSRVCRTAFQ
jgi:hypothetical protein